jgi:hypothetical protein
LELHQLKISFKGPYTTLQLTKTNDMEKPP